MGPLLGVIFGEIIGAIGSARDLTKTRIAQAMRRIAHRIDTGDLDLDAAIARAKGTQAKIDSTLDNLPD